MKGEHATFKISESCNLIFLKINQSINQSIIYLDMLRRGARKLVQNTNLYK